jgi:hypothetical protein
MKAFSIALMIAAGASVASLANEQASTSMKQPKKAKTSVYAGCIQAAGQDGGFVLTHVASGRMDVKQDGAAMGHDVMMPASDAMAADHDGGMAMPSILTLTGRSDFRKHVGQKVSVTGTLSKGATSSTRGVEETLSVRSLKVLAKMCSQESE